MLNIHINASLKIQSTILKCPQINCPNLRKDITNNFDEYIMVRPEAYIQFSQIYQYVVYNE